MLFFEVTGQSYAFRLIIFRDIVQSDCYVPSNDHPHEIDLDVEFFEWNFEHYDFANLNPQAI